MLIVTPLGRVLKYLSIDISFAKVGTYVLIKSFTIYSYPRPSSFPTDVSCTKPTKLHESYNFQVTHS